MAALQAGEVHVWTACPDDFGDAQWRRMLLLLDHLERIQSERFKHEADRRAYVLAHALRRTALAGILEVAPSALVFSSEVNAKPVLIAPRDETLFFSHSRSRACVACAVTRIGPVGIDVEPIQPGKADFELLANFVALPDAQRREAELGASQSRQFFFYWTALEAFWKAAGTGLASANPRIRCQKNQLGQFEITSEANAFDAPNARLISLQSPANCSIALVLNDPLGHVGEAGIEIKRNFVCFV
jgi:4'-phosphopantetheinyl transferase